MRYYIADLHFGHGGLNNRMDNRKFESVEAMDEYMIAQWNSRVRRNDEVVILGDFAIYKHGEQVNQLLTRLKAERPLFLVITMNLSIRKISGQSYWKNPLLYRAK